MVSLVDAMFFRVKKSGPRSYLQIVENRWESGGARQRVIATLGRLDRLQQSGGIDALLQSGARFAQSLLVVSAQGRGEAVEVATRRIGPALVFERLWRETGCAAVITELLADRRFKFPVERAIFLTVLHRLCDPGSDRAAEKWRRGYRIEGVDELDLHHLYRAMAWLGQPLPADAISPGQSQSGGGGEAETGGDRCTKDLIEEGLFARRRDLFSSLDLVFFDTTSIYFEGEGGEHLGQYGHSKDHRPDRKQMVVGAVLDAAGRPICCELWPGNTADVTSLAPVVDRLRDRFGIGRICIVADRGMISARAIEAVEQRGWSYILGARMRAQKEVRETVLGRGGRWRVVHEKGSDRSKSPSPLKVKDVTVEGRRYVVCLNVDQAKKDAADRAAIVAALQDQLRQGDKALVGNKGYRKYLKATGKRFVIDREKIEAEARYDGKWVLRTNTNIDAADVALKYKQLWTVEALFRSVKSILSTRPIYHKCDETIRGHVFCSFLALVLMKELQDRLRHKGYALEWADIIRDLSTLDEVEIEHEGKRFLLRTEAKGVCGKVMAAAGVALPPTVRQIAPNP